MGRSRARGRRGPQLREHGGKPVGEVDDRSGAERRVAAADDRGRAGRDRHGVLPPAEVLLAAALPEPALGDPHLQPGDGERLHRRARAAVHRRGAAATGVTARPDAARDPPSVRRAPQRNRARCTCRLRPARDRQPAGLRHRPGARRRPARRGSACRTNRARCGHTPSSPPARRLRVLPDARDRPLRLRVEAASAPERAAPDGGLPGGRSPGGKGSAGRPPGRSRRGRAAGARCVGSNRRGRRAVDRRARLMDPRDVFDDATVFFDLGGTLVLPGDDGAVLNPAAASWLEAGARRGVLCNDAPGEVRWTLEAAGIYNLFELELVVLAAQLPCPLPDRRAFAVAAALAEAPIADCVFVSADSDLVAAAEAAGMQATPLESEPAAMLAGDRPTTRRRRPTAVDGSRGPTFVLEGRIVTMGPGHDVIEGGRLALERSRIARVVPRGERLPEEFADAPLHATGGTIYPGLIDLHNHFVYNAVPLWTVPRRYDNRAQWQRLPAYSGGISQPVKALAAYPETARAIVRYVEAKALTGGTTTGQGMRTKVEGGFRLFRGAMRNVEQTGDGRLAEAGTRVPSLYVNPQGVADFRGALDRRTAYFYHLAEGLDDAAHRNFTDLADNDLLALLASGVPFALGCDWSPSGSKNLLQELKIARWVVQQQGVGESITDERLVSGVTADPARILGWQDALGSLVTDAYADLIVLAGDDADPYSHLIDATEADVSLVVVHGVPRYGVRDAMATLHTEPEHPLEEVAVDGTTKAFALWTRGSELNDLSFAKAQEILRDAMADLPAFRDFSQRARAQLASMEVVPSFVLELDNEWEPTPDELREFGGEPELAADPNLLVESLELDSPIVGADDYWDRIARQPNIADGLKDTLRSAYG